jgi:tRNA (uracil-5-)-methyltransferase TRM9
VTPKIITTLNQINAEFYKQIGHEFDQTRLKPWNGWLKLLPHIWQLPQPISMLDLGGGNGRFGAFVGENTTVEKYLNVDLSTTLLQSAKDKVAKAITIEGDLTEAQTFKQIEGQFELISLIAVLHHIPSLELRSQLLKRATKYLKPGGMLVFTAWQFLNIPTLVERIIPWDKYADIDQEQLEKNDFLLDWQRGQHAIRFCHLIDRHEIEELIQPLQLTKVDQFFADGKEDKSNIYVVLQKK